MTHYEIAFTIDGEQTLHYESHESLAHIVQRHAVKEGIDTTISWRPDGTVVVTRHAATETHGKPVTLVIREIGD